MFLRADPGRGTPIAALAPVTGDRESGHGSAVDARRGVVGFRDHAAHEHHYSTPPG